MPEDPLRFFRCRTCGTKNFVAESLYGSVVDCAECSEPYRVPKPKGWEPPTPERLDREPPRPKPPLPRPGRRVRMSAKSQVLIVAGCVMLPAIAAALAAVFSKSDAKINPGNPPQVKVDDARDLRQPETPIPPPKLWHDRGTLHSATIADWPTADTEDRISTCGSWILAEYKRRGKTIADDLLRRTAVEMDRLIMIVSKDVIAEDSLTPELRQSKVRDGATRIMSSLLDLDE